MRFYLGTHMVSWVRRDLGVSLFLSRNRLVAKTLPVAACDWALDSGGFTELDSRGEWSVDAETYAAFVRRVSEEMGRMVWAAPQDWMCEPIILANTGLTVVDHQRLTLENWLWLRDLAPDLPIIPVLQGWTPDDYERHVELYDRAGVDLVAEPLVGVGTVCRRQATREARIIMRRLVAYGLRLHGFGVKKSGLTGKHAYADALASADSMAWSSGGRWQAEPCPEGKTNCANCLHKALEWMSDLEQRLPLNLWKETPCAA